MEDPCDPPLVLPLHNDPAHVALAESLVDEALAPLPAETPPSAREEVRDFLVDELLCTDEGRATLLRLLPRPGVVPPRHALLPRLLVHLFAKPRRLPARLR
jgi:hypothetical protein